MQHLLPKKWFQILNQDIGKKIFWLVCETKLMLFLRTQVLKSAPVQSDLFEIDERKKTLHLKVLASAECIFNLSETTAFCWANMNNKENPQWYQIYCECFHGDLRNRNPKVQTVWSKLIPHYMCKGRLKNIMCLKFKNVLQ